MKRLFAGLAAFPVLLLPTLAHAQAAVPGALDRAFSSMNGGPGGGLSMSLQILLLMGLLTILPTLVLMMTTNLAIRQFGFGGS